MMDKTININIAGTLFQIDEEAFRILRDYLNEISNRFKNAQGGHETIDDIESRIAEIFQSQKGLAGVISKENVESMISIIGKPEDFDQEESSYEQPSQSYQRKKMFRNPDDSIVGGVCGGLGAYLNADPVIFRILFVLFTFFGVGAFVYIVMWIALPVARTDAQRREMYGNAYHAASKGFTEGNSKTGSSAPLYNSGYYNSTGIGNAFNEVFRAIGKVCWVIWRIFMILFGSLFVIFGFLIILSTFMLMVFKFPAVFTPDGVNVQLAYYQDFLSYIVSPSAAPWIIALALIVVTLPMLGLIYLGVKMIFWFRAKDGIYSLSALVIWVLAGAALTMILFNEGISFAETGRTSDQTILTTRPDTLFIVAENNVPEPNDFKQFSVPDEDFTMLMNDSLHQLWIPAQLRLNITEDGISRVEIAKRSSARTRSDATRKAESLDYNFRVSNDTIFLNEYFTLPAGSRWTADFLKVNLFVPENTVLCFNKRSENMFQEQIIIGKYVNEEYGESHYDSDTDPWELNGKYWIINEEGLTETIRAPFKQK
jgi:phage shock protein PspC (stress-responsive transcriptional regulator)